MMRFPYTLVLCLSLLLGVSVVRAGALTWDQASVAVTAAPNATVVPHSFTFTNTSDAPVTIEAVKTSCGCTTTKLEKLTYAPGESGAIAAEMKVDVNGTGEPVKRTIYVTVAEGKRRSYSLTFAVTVPTYVVIDPEVLAWEKGAAATAQVLDIRIPYETPIRITKATAGNGPYQVKLTTVEAGRHYRATVTPTSTANTGMATLTFTSDFPADAPMSWTVRTVIRQAPPKPGFWDSVWIGVLRLVP